METALHKCIKALESQKMYAPGDAFALMHDASVYNMALENAIKILKNNLPYEWDIISDAYTSGLNGRTSPKRDYLIDFLK